MGRLFLIERKIRKKLERPTVEIALNYDSIISYRKKKVSKT